MPNNIAKTFICSVLSLGISLAAFIITSTTSFKPSNNALTNSVTDFIIAASSAADEKMLVIELIESIMSPVTLIILTTTFDNNTNASIFNLNSSADPTIFSAFSSFMITITPSVITPTTVAIVAKPMAMAAAAIPTEAMIPAPIMAASAIMMPDFIAKLPSASMRCTAPSKRAGLTSFADFNVSIICAAAKISPARTIAMATKPIAISFTGNEPTFAAMKAMAPAMAPNKPIAIIMPPITMRSLG